MGMSNHYDVRNRRLTRRSALALAPLIGLPAVVAAQVPTKLPRIGVIAWEGPETALRIDADCALPTEHRDDGDLRMTNAEQGKSAHAVPAW